MSLQKSAEQSSGPTQYDEIADLSLRAQIELIGAQHCREDHELVERDLLLEERERAADRRDDLLHDREIALEERERRVELGEHDLGERQRQEDRALHLN